MPGSNSRPNVSEGYEVPLSYRGDRPGIGLLNIDNTTSVNRDKIYVVFLFMSAAWQTIFKIVC